MRVLHYHGTNAGMTGVETFILSLSAAQARSGMKPRVTCEFTGRSPFVCGARALGVPMIDFPARGAAEDALPRKVGTARLRARRVRALVRLLRESDILHVHAVGFAGLDAFVAAALTRTPVVVTHHTTIGFDAATRSAAEDATFLLEKRMSRAVVMPYARAAREMVDGGVRQERVHVIPFGVDDGRFPLGSAHPPSDVFRVVLVGRIVPGKGHAELLRAIGCIRRKHPELRVTILGDGPDRASIERLADELAIRDVVDVTGWVAHDEVPALMRAAHVVVLPSYMDGETFPLSLMEGMALGLPAIGSTWFGIPDIVEHGRTGLVVPPRDADALAAAIDKLASDHAFYAAASRAAVERVRERFTLDAVGRAYSRIYSTVASKAA